MLGPGSLVLVPLPLHSAILQVVASAVVELRRRQQRRSYRPDPYNNHDIYFVYIQMWGKNKKKYLFKKNKQF